MCSSGCNPTCWRLRPCVVKVAAPRAGGWPRAVTAGAVPGAVVPSDRAAALLVPEARLPRGARLLRRLLQASRVGCRLQPIGVAGQQSRCCRLQQMGLQASANRAAGQQIELQTSVDRAAGSASCTPAASFGRCVWQGVLRRLDVRRSAPQDGPRDQHQHLRAGRRRVH